MLAKKNQSAVVRVYDSNKSETDHGQNLIKI